MKKKITLALAAAFTLSIAGTVLAAPNAFADVPAKHWAYDSVNKLAKAGMISGYGDGSFQGDRTLTRYEMAILIAKAMNNTEKMNAETKATLNKLEDEFKTELGNIGIRLDTLEKKSDNVTIKGDIRIRYRHVEENAGGVKTTTIPAEARSRLVFTGKIDDQWSWIGRLQNITDFKNPNVNDSKTDFNVAYVSGNVLGGTYDLGKQEVCIFDGLVIDNTADGNFKGAAISYKLGDINATARYGKQVQKFATSAIGTLVAATPGQQDTYSGLELNAKSGKVNLGAAYHNISDRGGTLKDLKITELSAAAPISPVINVSAGYAKSNADDENKAYTLLVRYKKFDRSQQGCFSPYVQYRHTEKNALYKTTYDEDSVADGGAKAIEVGVDYAPWKNVKFETYYIDAKSILNSNDKDKFFCSYLRYYF